MKTLNRRDGFCRAPRIELVSEDNRFKTMSFDEMLNSAKFGLDVEESMGIVKNLTSCQETRT